MKALVAAGGAFGAATIVPTRWTRPIIDTVIIPVHAQSSAVSGLFATGLPPGLSILDYIVQPVHAVSAGTVICGNASFDVVYDVGASGYDICGAGYVNEGKLIPFEISGSGERNGSQLENFSQAIPNGTLSLTNQVVDVSGVFCLAQYGSSQTKFVAPPGSGGCFINTLTSLRLSSPYPDEKPT